MDWLQKKNWFKEDEEFSPKREVNNKKSKFMHHSTGHVYSRKMKRHVGYESLWGECLFYYFLELDPLTVRFYEQPVEIPIRYFNENNILESWIHVPDVLVFRQGFKPHLYQIKIEGYDEKTKDVVINKACEKYSEKRNWDYSLLKTKEGIPDVIISNVFLLTNFLKPRKHYEKYIPEIINKMKYVEQITVIELAKSFSAKADFRFVLPIVYHLIGIGRLRTNLYETINEKSEVQLGSNLDDVFLLFEKKKVK
ncbi:hypothetical protein GMD78_13150 [Ornithinibacillus sp. L9]|uniref:TnsA endonuclease N-terminal domain-containing protein n=1 Tax=Ornithinibacillus caprae TaxID=2678566 RepID=A0A6N8FNF9_9BACI|nr:hypothetical protein [Ornithinibacillus caprae]MUK89319.1 hypothetical protein [Ornithinibacillus caprae]